MDSSLSIFLNINTFTVCDFITLSKNIYITNSLPKEIIYVNNNITIIFKGVIYNFKKLCDMMNLSNVDNCYLIYELYLNYDIELTLQLLDGEFVLIIIDIDYDENNSNLYISQDCFNKKQIKTAECKEYGEQVIEISDFTGASNSKDYYLKNVPNGTYSHYTLSYKVLSYWEFHENKKYYYLPLPSLYDMKINENTINDIKINLNYLLELSIKNNLINVDYNSIICNVNYDNTMHNKLQNICGIDIKINETQFSTNDLILKNIHKDKIIFCNDGFDEFFGNQFEYIDDPIYFDIMTRNYITSYFSEKNLSNVENVKFPYVDKELIHYYFTIPLLIRFKYRKNSELLNQ